MWKSSLKIVLLNSVFVVSCAHSKNTVTDSVEENNKDTIVKSPVTVKKSKPKEKKLKVESNAISNVFKSYGETSGLKLLLKKKVKSGILGKETDSSGELYFSKGNLRLELNKPQKSLLVISKNNIYFSQKLDKDFGGHWQVYQAKKRKVIKSQILVGVIFGDKKIWSQLEEKGVVKIGDKVFYFFEPIKGSTIKNIKKIGVVLTKNKKDILMFKYWDHVENETTYLFKDIKKNLNFKKNLFRYKIPKNSELIYL